MGLYLLFFFFTYLILTMILPRWRLRKRTGREALVVPHDDSAQAFIGKVFRFLFFLVPVVLVLNVFWLKSRIYLLPADFLEIPVLQYGGLILLHLSLLLVVVAQYQMDRSWRVGFELDQQTELVEKGLFRYSRNPVFLGMLLTMFGLFLTVPNAFTLLALVLAYVVLQIQVRLEEEFLVKLHGQPYEEYKRAVRRWI